MSGQRDRPRMRLAAAASVGSAVALGLGLAMPTFWQLAGEQGTSRVGLLWTTMCVGEVCRSAGLAALGGGKTWMMLGATAFVAGLVATLLHLVIAVLAAVGKPASRWYRPGAAAGASLFAFSLAAAFVVAEPGLGLPAGPALTLYFVGAGTGLAAGLALHPRPARPASP